MKRYLFLQLLLVTCSFSGIGQSLWEIRIAPFSMGVANDYAPALFQNGVIFSSDRIDDIFNQYRTIAGERTSNLYFVVKKDSVHYGRPRNLLPQINTFVNEGPVSYDAMHHVLYFTRNLLLDKKNKKQPNYTGIFYIDYNNGNWGTVHPFVYNNPAYNVGHPAVSPDGKMLFIASDMPGGYGRSDLYVCYRQGNGWSKPENLGKKVNSAASDLYPFFHPSGRLYFASDRAGFLGKLDIFFTFFNDGQWILPVHLDAPFNSPADDYAYVVDSSMHAGLFTSTRRGRDNIFMFTSLLPEMKGCNPVEEPANCFLFYETQSKNTDTIPIKYKWDFGDGMVGYGHTVEHCFDKPGQYLARLSVTDTITGEVRESVATYLVEVVESQEPYITAPDTCFTGEEIHLDGSETRIPGFQPEQYFWDLGDGNLAEGSEVKTIYHTPGVFVIRLLVRGMTNTGNRVDKCVYKEIRVLNRGQKNR